MAFEVTRLDSWLNIAVTLIEQVQERYRPVT